jgi:hypothetical protein
MVTLSVVLVAGVGCLIIYAVSRALELHPTTIWIDNPRREMRMAIVVLLASSLVIVVLNFVLIRYAWPWLDSMNLRAGPHDLILLTITGIMNVIFLLPMMLGIRRTRQPLASIGVTRQDAFVMVKYGIVLSLIFSSFYIVLALLEGSNIINATTTYFVTTYLVGTIGRCAFVILIMGYIQTRVTVYASSLRGVVAAALLYAPFASSLGLPTQMLFGALDAYQIMYGMLAAVAWGFILGYVKRMSGSIIPDLIFMASTGWIQVLFNIQ